MSTDLERQYRETADYLNLMIEQRDSHVAHVGDNCGAAPLCIGPIASIDLMLEMSRREGFAASLILVSVNEMSRMRHELADAKARVQALTAALVLTGE